MIGTTILNRDKLIPFLGCIIVAIWFAYGVSKAFPDTQGTDYYPVVEICAGEVLSGRSPYTEKVSQLIVATWDIIIKKHVHVAPVCAYPLPFYILVAPFALLPIGMGVPLWFALILLFPGIFWMLNPNERPKMLLPVVYYPILHGALIKNSTVVWAILIAVLLLALRNRCLALVGAISAILPAKPQVGLLISSFTGTAAAVGSAGGRIALAVSFILFWGVPFIFFPDWPLDWLAAVQQYSSNATVIWFMPFELLVPVLVVSTLVFSRISFVATAAIWTLTIFPVNDLYCAIPLVFAWNSLPLRYAIPGAGLSWLIPLIYEYPNNLEGMWIFLLLPLLLAGVAYRYRNICG
jgi:hypothetical protein